MQKEFCVDIENEKTSPWSDFDMSITLRNEEGFSENEIAALKLVVGQLIKTFVGSAGMGGSVLGHTGLILFGAKSALMKIALGMEVQDMVDEIRNEVRKNSDNN